MGFFSKMFGESAPIVEQEKVYSVEKAVEVLKKWDSMISMRGGIDGHSYAGDYENLNKVLDEITDQKEHLSEVDLKKAYELAGFDQTQILGLDHEFFDRKKRNNQ